MSIAFLFLCLPFAAWVCILLLQTLGAVMPVPALLLASQRPRIAVLIPAHNEAAGITATLKSIRPQMRPGDRLLVVADNCSDDTATVALAAGAEVVERRDISLRGKGYALDCGIRHLAGDAPKVVIVVDADCIAEPGALDCLARACMANGRPVQALYLMQSPPSAGAFAELREFAWIFRNLVRPLGCLRFDLPCQLMGTGMAFPWRLISSASLANAHLVEDMQLGVDLARAGAAPLLCPQAVVCSEFPAGEADVRQQRRRWEHGHLGMIAATVPALLRDALKRGDADLLALALDMSVPPLALLAMLLLVLAALSAFIPSPLALPFALGLLTALLATILLAWWCHGRDVLRLRTLLLVPLYVIAKLPLYFAFLYRRQVEWVRSSRE